MSSTPTTPTFEVGQKVDRIEDRDITGATILSIQQHDAGFDEFATVELLYDEGGTGWWPTSALKPKDTTE
jgi:hypothetical protein